MKRKINKAILLVATLIFILSGCCKGPSEKSNVKLINSSGEDLQSMGYSYINHSGGAINADNSFIRPGENMNFNIEDNKFVLKVTDRNGKTFESETFKFSFENESKLPLVFQVSKEANNKFVFKRKY
jgi:hypothetical protein